MVLQPHGSLILGYSNISFFANVKAFSVVISHITGKRILLLILVNQLFYHDGQVIVVLNQSEGWISGHMQVIVLQQ